MSTMYVMEVMSEGLGYEILLNDIAISQNNGYGQASSQSRVNQFVVDGENQFSVKVLCPEDVDGAHELSVRLMSGEPGTQPGEEAIIDQITWRYSSQEFDKNKWYSIYDKSIGSIESKRKWAWQSAEKIRDISIHKSGILKSLMIIRTALANKSSDDTLKSLKIRNEQISLATEVPIDKINLGFSQFLNSFFKQEEWEVAELKQESLSYTLRADGLMVDVKDIELGSTITASAGGRIFKLNLSFSLINGEWIAVR